MYPQYYNDMIIKTLKKNSEKETIIHHVNKLKKIQDGHWWLMSSPRYSEAEIGMIAVPGQPG
jgi:hypothetical protein